MKYLVYRNQRWIAEQRTHPPTDCIYHKCGHHDISTPQKCADLANQIAKREYELSKQR